ncbi:hypothetical protein NW757_014388 [Fusarium falciforme]|nr:hypothetical protein NW757_014388 [Fusarium falciforme]
MASPDRTNQPDSSELFAVHVFIHHNLYVASAFLPSLFTSSAFPEELWKLPPLPGVSDLVDSRNRLGRYVLRNRLPGSARIAQVAEQMETEFKFHSRFQAGYKVLPPPDPGADEEIRFPEWQGRTLPPDTSLEQAYSYGVYKPEGKLQLVLETKAAALAPIAGVDFVEDTLGKEYKAFRSLFWRETYDDIYGINRFSIPVVVKALRSWRYTYYKLKFLEEVKAKLAGRTPEDSLTRSDTAVGQEMQEVDREVDEVTMQKQEATAKFQASVERWEEWVLDKCVQSVMMLRDEDIEATWESMRQKRNELVEAWKNSERRQDIWKGMRELYLANPQLWLRRDDLDAQDKMDAQNAERRTKAMAARGQMRNDHLREFSKQAEETTPRNITSSAITTRSFRNADGSLSKELSAFEVTSGVLLWGQILPIHYGVGQPALTSNATTVPRAEPGGTVLMHLHTYKSAARVGTWKVRRYYSSIYSGWYGNASAPVGWVICHESVDPMEILRRVRCIGNQSSALSNSNEHADKDVLFIARYDWGWYPNTPEYRESRARFQEWAEPVIGALPEGTDADEYRGARVNVAEAGYFMAVDGENWGLDLVRAYKDECEVPLPVGERQMERIFETQPEGRRVGSYVESVSTGYQFGWLVFSGNKHEKYPEADELIAFVYDAEYEALEAMQHDVEADPDESG